jgi:Sec-independent protein translocase protein TatA
MILLAGGHDCMGCFTDQVKLTHALVRDLGEAIKEVKLLGEHEEESSQKITELEPLCKKLREDTQRLEEEKATLEEMVKSRDELLTEVAGEMGLDRMGEDEDDEEDVYDRGDATAPRAAAPPPPVPPAAVPEEINEEGPVEVIPEQEAPMPCEVVLADVEPEMSQLRLYHALMRDYEENPLRLEDDFDDPDDDPREDHPDMDK